MTATDPQPDLSDRLSRCYTGVVHDVMRDQGFDAFTLPPEIRLLQPERCLAGPAFTVSGRLVPGTGADETLLAWTGLLGRVPPGHVVVCQPNNHTIALMGELSAETLQLRGARGYLVDGGCRDADFILRLGFPVACRFLTPRDIVGKWLPDAFDQPVTIGDVTVAPGDYVLSDRDGTVIVPRAAAADIVARAEAAIATENLVRKAILDGVHPQDAYRRYGKF